MGIPSWRVIPTISSLSALDWNIWVSMVAIFGMRLREGYLTAQFLNGAQTILRTVERFRSLGYRETHQGVRLFGPVPHVARQAWCHAIPRTRQLMIALGFAF
jgi:hypothetical protein